MINTAKGRVYASTTHCSPATVAERSAAMRGRATFTMVRSSCVTTKLKLVATITRPMAVLGVPGIFWVAVVIGSVAYGSLLLRFAAARRAGRKRAPITYRKTASDAREGCAPGPSNLACGFPFPAGALSKHRGSFEW